MNYNTPTHLWLIYDSVEIRYFSEQVAYTLLKSPHWLETKTMN
jgi:hypothetical protein